MKTTPDGLKTLASGQWPAGGYDPELESLFQEYALDAGELDLTGLLHDQRLGRTAIVSSFGAESAVLLHRISRVKPDIEVIFLDTERHFPATLAYVETLTKLLELNVIRARPDGRILREEDPNSTLAISNPDQCCMLRKTFPLADAMQDFDCWISGRKRFHNSERAIVPLMERDGEKIKINPLAFWDKDRIDAYFEEHALPRHPLQEFGYPSIGCESCTLPVTEGDDPRSGRWARSPDKTECGIHISPDGKIVRGSGET